jgi:hypothetical protein
MRLITRPVVGCTTNVGPLNFNQEAFSSLPEPARPRIPQARKAVNESPDKRKRQRPCGLWRFILEDLAVLIDCCVFRLLSSQPPVCTVDQPSSLAFQFTSDFHRRSIFWRCLPTQLPTLIGCQILRSTFRSVSSLRLQPLFQLSLPVNLRLASPINLPVPPSHRPATCAACRSSDRLSDCSPACAFDQSSAKLSGQSFDSRL